MRVFDLRREDGVHRPLLQDQLGDPQVHGLGVVVHDVAVFDGLGEHQPVEVIAGDAVQRKVLQLGLMAAGGEIVVDQLADQLGADGFQAAGDHLVFHGLGYAQRHVRRQPDFFRELPHDARTVPRQRFVRRHGLHQQQTGVGDILGRAGPGLAHPDMLARLFAQFAVAFVRRHDGGIALIRQHDFHEVLHILDAGDAMALGVRRDEVFVLRLGQLRQYAVGDPLRHVRRRGHARVTCHAFHRLADRQ